MPTTYGGPITHDAPITHGGPATDTGKAISSRNATTHGVFARDVVLPALGEDPAGYAQLQAEWTKQLTPRNLLEQHYVEKIAAASWRLRRLHRWQAQLYEDDTLSEAERLDRLNAVLRHETALHRQIDTAVKLLHKDVPQLYARRLRDGVLEDLHITERECRDEPETDLGVSLETSNRLYQLKKATTQAANELSEAPLDNAEADAAEDTQICRNELAATPQPLVNHEICRNEPVSPTTRRLPQGFPTPVRRIRSRKAASSGSERAHPQIRSLADPGKKKHTTRRATAIFSVTE